MHSGARAASGGDFDVRAADDRGLGGVVEPAERTDVTRHGGYRAEEKR